MKRFLTLTTLLCITLSFAQQKHTASNYESIESIAKIYRLSPADILKLNPGIKEGIQKGVTINIPTSKVKHYSTQRPVGFTSHLVKSGETFFGLSQKYNISIDDLKRYNLDLYTRELQENERITIPLFNKTNDMVQKGIQGQKRYVVKPQETLWKIAKNHNVSVEELERINKKEKGFNPNNIKEGQEIWVPASAVDSSEPEVPTRPATNKELVLYLIEKGEGFYSLERKFGLSQSDIVKLNPTMKDGLKSDAQIWIPKENYDRYKNTPFTSTPNYDFENSNNTLRSTSSPNNVKEISYILPFKVADIGSTNKAAALKARLTDNKITPVATDFYSGVLIALDSLQKMGYKFKVNVYDSEGDIKKITSNANIQNSQVVIGPFTTKSFNAVAELITNNKTAVLAPLANKNIVLNPNVYQTLPSDEVQQNQMINYLNKNYSDENMIILADSKNTGLRDKLERAFPNAKVVTEMSANGFANALNYSKENVVLLQSNDIGYVSLAVRLLHNALKVKKNNAHPKIILATVERGNVFDSNSLSNNQLSDLHFTYPTVNKYSNGSDSFSVRYQKTYGILPNKYAIRGFDLTMDAVLRLGVSGNLNSTNTRIGETSFLENKFAYLKNSYKGGGYENQGVYIVQYDNMEIKEVK
ncbi:LysM peptidoglycan-binding domain-containing protein [Capnocytophaga genosp. AHN8471]|jgi:lysM domain protein|uniref:LysM peptidoglycan-binding domain-containing protein n=1 Tax=Capnocytophaga genosp. AHN8471 TaxID=327574 RepID=UPI0019315E03|nr:LysM peptidoglycan-binding domain-containing protein [Capnocytophaga genosp. AHN8471]MBM0652363.1 LysM peptidoglycan-binding domain-containing protein [Capnocytophaga genosp. AHN8471]